MLVDIDNRNQNDFIIEDLDEEHLLVKDTKVAALKARLHQVSFTNAYSNDGLTPADVERAPQGPREGGQRRRRLAFAIARYDSCYMLALSHAPSYSRRLLPLQLRTHCLRRHGLLLCGVLDLWNPRNTVRGEEFGDWLEGVERVDVVERAHLCRQLVCRVWCSPRGVYLEDHHAGKGGSITPHGRTTVTTSQQVRMENVTHIRAQHTRSGW